MKAKSSCCQPISPRRLRGERRVGLALVSRRIAGRIIGFLRFARKKPRVWNLCGLGTERVSPRTSPILAKLGSRRRSPRPAEILGDAARGLGGRAAEALAGGYACGAVNQAQLSYYLDEFTFRFNARREVPGKLFERLLQQAVTTERIPYRGVVARSRSGRRPD